jgi:hypothetical protein
LETRWEFKGLQVFISETTSSRGSLGSAGMDSIKKGLERQFKSVMSKLFYGDRWKVSFAEWMFGFHFVLDMAHETVPYTMGESKPTSFSIQTS